MKKLLLMPMWRNWQTRTTQNRVPSGVSVRPRPSVSNMSRVNPSSQYRTTTSNSCFSEVIAVSAISDDADIGVVDVRVMKYAKSDVGEQPWAVSLEIGNKRDNLAVSQTDLERTPADLCGH